ncbi:MAG: NUDIX hydrolase [Ilumatobacteraceae bacterium]
MRWTVHGERVVYDSPWVRLALADVEIPGGPRFEHHVVRTPAAASGTVVVDAARGVLMLWRHRFITDTWGWEIPGGRIDDGESPADAAARETLEETGWRTGPLRHMVTYHPLNGLSDATFHLFEADGAHHVGDPVDTSESERIEWLDLDRVRHEIATGQVVDGLSLTALLWWLTMAA